MTTDFAPYQKLDARMREAALLTSSESVLNWDQDTCMPPEASLYRAEQRTYLTSWARRLATTPDLRPAHHPAV